MNLLATRNGKRLLFSALYFSEGAPIGFIWWALPPQMRMAGFSLEHITSLTSLLVLPWMFKFVLAPLVDGLRNKFWTLKSWVLSTQLIMGSSFLILALAESPLASPLMVPMLVVHALSAAIQDTAVDALAISTVPEPERGLLNGWMQGGMLCGRALFSGGTLFMIATAGERAVFILLAAAIWCSSLLLLLADVPEAERHSEGIQERVRRFRAALVSMARGRTFWVAIAFALISGAAFEAVGAMAGPLLVDRGATNEHIAVFFGVNVVVAMVAGALAGGWSSDRWGNILMLKISMILLIVSVLAVALLTERSESLLATLTFLYFWIGAFTATSYTLFMNITSEDARATEFSTFMGATNGCESWATFAVGRAVPVFGYGGAFALMCIPSLIAFGLLEFLGSNKREE